MWCGVELKSFSPSFFPLTGKKLLRLVTVAIALVALLLDTIADRAFNLSMLMPIIACTAIAGSLGYGVIPLLQKLKAGQIIREDGPQSHHQKAGTPTMGGIFFVPVALGISCLWAGLNLGFASFQSLLPVVLVTLSYGAIGWLDDWQILRQKSNKGISPKMKLGLQIACAVVFCLWLAGHQPPGLTNIQLPLGMILPLGLLFFPLAVFVMVAESNATNLTDGVDGLAAGTGAIAFLGLGAVVASTHPELMIFCACFSGSCLGFLIHNRNKAKVFMGDTGSLAIGGALAAVGIYSGQLWALFVLSGLFFVESLSVIAQVGYYKATKNKEGVGKRLLKMAPLHHHLELSGWRETQVVAFFYLLSGVLAFLVM